MVCRSKAKDAARPGAWNNLDIFTDGVLLVKNLTLNGNFCHVSLMVNGVIIIISVDKWS
jgi:hypothetical protein